MGIFRNKKNKPQDTTFTEVQKISGGNSFETRVQLDAQDAINKYEATFNALKNDNGGKKFISERTLSVYWLLTLQANYFCNTIKFKCEDESIRQAVLKVIRCAFFYGLAGLYYDKTLNKIYPVAIVESKINLFGEYDDMKITAIDNYLLSQSSVKDMDINSFNQIHIKGEDCKNCYVFKWGMFELSAWVIMLPFIKQQESILGVVGIEVFSYLKKLKYRENSPSASKNEMEMFWDPLNPFICEAGATNGVSNRFEIMDMNKNSSATKTVIDYYNDFIKIYYNLYGRRVNTDNKKERNITSEVQASQENYNVLQSEYKNQFEIFADMFNKGAGKKCKIEVIDEEEENEKINKSMMREKPTNDNKRND